MATVSARSQRLWWRQNVVDHGRQAIKDNILGRMQQQGVTQRQLAARLGVSQPRISTIVNSDEPIESDLLIRIAQCLGTTMAELCTPGRFPPQD